MLGYRPDWHIFNLDALTYAGNPVNHQDLENNPGYTFIHGNICDAELLSRLFETHRFDGVFHFAAESHVDRSIAGPEIFLNTNVMGTFRLLEAGLTHYRKYQPSNFRFLHVSTDEVYGSLTSGDPAFTETSPYDPSSPYAASKTSSDHFVKAYHKTFGLPVVVTNCSNNYGPYQFPEKLIPLMILNIMDIKTGQKAGVSRELITFVKDRPGHDIRYAINPDKACNKIGYKACFSFKQALSETIDWYPEHPDWVRSVQTGAYQDWITSHYGEK